MTPQVNQRRLSRRSLAGFLDEMAARPGEAASLYLPPGAEIETELGRLDMPPEIREQAAGYIEKSATGTAVFWGEAVRCLVLPPFPVTGPAFAATLDEKPLRELLAPDYSIALVLVRLGAYTVGVAAGEKLVSSKVGTGNIHGRHRKGGSSAHRFERHRDKQMEYFFTRLCQHAREHIEPHARELEYIVYGGARETIRLLLKQCDFLGRLQVPELPPLLDIAEPRRAVLEKALSRVWTSTVIEWEEG
jgi:hypothetical protein